MPVLVDSHVQMQGNLQQKQHQWCKNLHQQHYYQMRRFFHQTSKTLELMSLQILLYQSLVLHMRTIRTQGMMMWYELFEKQLFRYEQWLYHEPD